MYHAWVAPDLHDCLERIHRHEADAEQTRTQAGSQGLDLWGEEQGHHVHVHLGMYMCTWADMASAADSDLMQC